jgi:predicted RNA methylase
MLLYRKLEKVKPEKYKLSEEGRQNIIKSNKEKPRTLAKTILKKTQNNVMLTPTSGLNQARSKKKNYGGKRTDAASLMRTSTQTISRYNELERAATKLPNKDIQYFYSDKDAKVRYDESTSSYNTYAELFEGVKERRISIDKAYKRLKYSEKIERARKDVESAAKNLTLGQKVTLLNMDCTKITNAEIEDNSVDLIITDPPYGQDALQLYDNLASLASNKLKAGGSLVFHSGQYSLSEIFAIFSKYKDHLTYWWTFAVVHPYNKVVTNYARGVRSEWKPMLWFVKGERRLVDNHLRDCIASNTAPDKNMHPWAQSHDQATYVTKHLTISEEALVVDPFLGTGQFAIPAIRLGRYFVGLEIDKTTLEHARNYIITETSSNK